MTNDYRTMCTAPDKANIRTIADTGHLTGRNPFATSLENVGA